MVIGVAVLVIVALGVGIKLGSGEPAKPTAPVEPTATKQVDLKIDSNGVKLNTPGTKLEISNNSAPSAVPDAGVALAVPAKEEAPAKEPAAVVAHVTEEPAPTPIADKRERRRRRKEKEGGMSLKGFSKVSETPSAPPGFTKSN